MRLNFTYTLNCILTILKPICTDMWKRYIEIEVNIFNKMKDWFKYNQSTLKIKPISSWFVNEIEINELYLQILIIQLLDVLQSVSFVFCVFL